jgi:hypothetical protein
MGPAQYSSLLIHHPTPVRVRVYYSNKNNKVAKKTAKRVVGETKGRAYEDLYQRLC